MKAYDFSDSEENLDGQVDAGGDDDEGNIIRSSSRAQIEGSQEANEAPVFKSILRKSSLYSSQKTTLRFPKEVKIESNR